MIGIATAFLAGLLGAAAFVVIITVAFITAKWLKAKIMERQAQTENEIIFADLEEVVDSDVREQKDEQGEISPEELKKRCQSIPYAFAEYDKDKEEVVNFVGVDAKGIEEKLKRKIKERGGIVVFSG